jgi:NADH:ubiquinone reductase (H+-translocating)
MNIPKSKHPRIVIIGGGFAGIAFARELKNKPVQVVMIDKHNYHTFQPLLYQVATGGLEAGSIAYPIRKVMHHHPEFYFRLGMVTELDPKNHKIIADIGELEYDYLAIATGSKTNFFGNVEIERNSMAMKTIPQALNIRSLILENFEQALLIEDEAERNCLTNFCLVGGGPTGVELAGADRILNTMSAKSSAAAEKYLTDLGVKVNKNIRVTGYDGKMITTNSEVTFDTATVIWTAGVQGNTPDGVPASSFVEKTERYKVNEFNQVAGYDNIFAIGDIALMVSDKFPLGHPMLAQPAMQQGKLLGQNVIRKISNQKMKPFVYNDKGSMATIGRNKAVVDLPHYHFHGVFAWFVWMFIHLISLIGFKNKAVVLTNWIYNYIRFDREGRLIIRPYKRKSFYAFTSDEI